MEKILYCIGCGKEIVKIINSERELNVISGICEECRKIPEILAKEKYNFCPKCGTELTGKYKRDHIWKVTSCPGCNHTIRIWNVKNKKTFFMPVPERVKWLLPDLEPGFLKRFLLIGLPLAILLLMVKFFFHQNPFDVLGYLASILYLYVMLQLFSTDKGVQTFYCSHCHAVVSRNARFCPNCKITLSRAALDKEESDESARQKLMGIKFLRIFISSVILTSVNVILLLIVPSYRALFHELAFMKSIRDVDASVGFLHIVVSLNLSNVLCYLIDKIVYWFDT